jgi:hypothetical protein
MLQIFFIKLMKACEASTEHLVKIIKRNFKQRIGYKKFFVLQKQKKEKDIL